MPRRLLHPAFVPRSGAEGKRQARAAAVAASLLFGLVAAPAVCAAPPSPQSSQLLESVKNNPALANQMCARFKQLNAQGESATAPASVAAVASARGLSSTDAEILITYVIGLNCPDVR